MSARASESTDGSRGDSLLALFLAAVAVVVAVVEVTRARVLGRNVRWLIVMLAVVAGAALLWLWSTHLRFPLVQPVG